MEEWGDTLVAGALAKVKAMTVPRIEWSDPQGAAYHQEKYMEGVALARIQALRSRKRGGSLYMTGNQV